MAKKSTLFGGRTVKVENRSGFDKSYLNMFTTNVGTITPIVRKLLIPSSGRCSIPSHVELPPLASNAFLRSHWKMEAFFVPLRICYGGFQSWFSGEPVYDLSTNNYNRAELPFGLIVNKLESGATPPVAITPDPDDLSSRFGASSLTDFFNVKLDPDSTYGVKVPVDSGFSAQFDQQTGYGLRVNLFPYIAYHLIYDHFYRNKSVSLPSFTPPFADHSSSAPTATEVASFLPYESYQNRLCVVLGTGMDMSDGSSLDSYITSDYSHVTISDRLKSGYNLCNLHQRNFGDDYFTSARPSAQAGSPVVVQTDANGRFTISSLRLQNALQEFAENQNYATPDFIQTNMARYGVKLSDGIAQKPILLGSADFPIFTKAVELNSAAAAGNPSENPFIDSSIVGSKAGIASGSGKFSFDFDVKEPGYLMVMATLVPEANYSSGVSKEMRIFTEAGSLVDLPCSLLEHVGDEPIFEEELNPSRGKNVFGYVQRYLWHKAGSDGNQIHGLFRKGYDLQAFAPQRSFTGSAVSISTAFLRVQPDALDDVAAVTNLISQYGVQADCAVELFVSEPLTESALPALVNPASEHGRSIYLSNGGSKLS